MKTSLLITCLLGVAAAGVYDGYKVYSVTPDTEAQATALVNLENHGLFVDFWEFSDRPGAESVMMVSAADADGLVKHLHGEGLLVTVVHEDLQRVADAEATMNALIAAATPYRFGDAKSFNFAQYHRLADIHDFMESLVEDPAVAEIAEVFDLATSFEGRPLKTIKIGKASDSPKPVFYLHCNTHAREWITAATCVYQINEIITQYLAGNPDFQPLVNDMDWYIMPVHNPDGYEYTHTRSRYWRKTRSGPHSGQFGVDPNRNWDARWGGAGSSGSPRSDTYRGPNPFSEPETKAVSDFVLERKDSIKAFVEAHAYSNLWLIPYSYARNTQPEDGPELNSLSDEVVAAIRATHGQRYRPGTAANILYETTGGSHDWAKEKAGVKWAFVPEARPERAFGLSGFNPNPNQIVPCAQELLAGYRVIAERILADAKFFGR